VHDRSEGVLDPDRKREKQSDHSVNFSRKIPRLFWNAVPEIVGGVLSRS
jgi:hypothetical protein